jgi:rhodanese-related sulfurtransferase
MSSRQAPNSQVTVEELRRLAQSEQELFLLDVRTEPEFLTERLSFADARIPFDSLADNLARLPADKAMPIYTFCRSGRRSDIAAGFLRSAGYTRVYNVDGGIVAWKAAGFETVSGQ